MNTELDLLKHALNSHYGLSSAEKGYLRNDVTATQLENKCHEIYNYLNEVFKYCKLYGIKYHIEPSPIWEDIYDLQFRCGRKRVHKMIDCSDILRMNCSEVCRMVITCLEREFNHDDVLDAMRYNFRPVNYGEFYNIRRAEKEMMAKFDIKKVIFSGPCTIVLWGDDTKTVVRCENEEFDKEKGLAMAISKKLLGTNKSKSNYMDIFKKWCK